MLLKCEVSHQIMTISIVTYHRENFEMAIESKSFVNQRLGIKDYPPIFAYAESFYAMKYKHSFFKLADQPPSGASMLASPELTDKVNLQTK